MVVAISGLFAQALGIIIGAAISIAAPNVDITLGGDVPIMIRSHAIHVEFEIGGVLVSQKTIEDTAHGVGHWQQEMQLGGLYLPLVVATAPVRQIIALAAIPFVGIDRAERLYYSLPIESWADQLGGVQR